MSKTFTIVILLSVSRLVLAQSYSDTIYTHVGQMPYFQGCQSFEDGTDAKRRCSEAEMKRFISSHLVYPEKAKQAEVEGTVYVSFIVDEWGAVVNPALLIDIGYGCGEEALKVIAAMPPWEPARHQGQAVKVKLNLPIHFSLKENEPGNPDGYNLIWGTLRGRTVSVSELKNNLDQTVAVRDRFGNYCFIDELAFTFEKNKKLYNATSRGAVTSDLVKVIEKVKKGGTFTITASVQERGNFIYVTRSFMVLE